MSGGAPTMRANRWIGIYPPSPRPSWAGQVEWNGVEAVVHVSGNGWGTPIGYFVYRDDGQAPELIPFGGRAISTGNRVRHLHGPWFVVEKYPYGDR
jgi:hypothetical protein